MDNPEDKALLANLSAASFSRALTGTPQGGLHLALADGRTDFGGLLVEFLGGTVMINADCGDGAYAWLPSHEVAGSDDEDGGVAFLRFPELGSMLCCSLDTAVLVMAGWRRGEQQRRAEQRPSAGREMWDKAARSLRKFRALWAWTNDPDSFFA